MASPIYSGSHLFLSLSKYLGIPLDQLNFVVAESSGILFGFLLRATLPHSANRPAWRLAYCLVLGLAFLAFMIGKLTWIVVLQVVLCYLVLKYFPQAHVQLVVFFLALGYMLALYGYRFTKSMDLLCYDETYPLMITTQKITTLAFSLSDWRLLQRGKKMCPEREKWAVRELPGLLEYLAFTLSFQGVLAGPFCHFNLYRAFIEGNTKARLSEETKVPLHYQDDPSTCLRAVLTKVAAVALWTYITAWVKPFYPDSRNADPDFIAHTGTLARLWYLYISLFFHRAKYYVTWILADAVYNASGLGYTGKDEKGRPQWTGMTNVNVFKIETAPSLKVYLDNWNIMTTHWLRHVCYNRAPVQNTLLTFILSALWHGIYPGYYVTFVFASFFVMAGRKMRANVRPLFQGSQTWRTVYDIITLLGTQISLPFMVLSFVVLDLEGIIRFHKSFYCVVYIIVAALCIFLPARKKSASHSSSSYSTSASKEPQDGLDGKFSDSIPAQHRNGNNKSHHYGNGVRGGEDGSGTKLSRREGESVMQAS